MTKSHPSINTKSNILTGKEMLIGGIIIMPIVIKIPDTMRSTNKKGKKIILPAY